MNDAISSSSLATAQSAYAQAKVPPKIGNISSLARARQVAQDFEAFYLGQMLQPMFANIEPSEPFDGGTGNEIWRSMQVDEYGKAMARAGGIGLADAVFKQILLMQEAEGNGNLKKSQ